MIDKETNLGLVEHIPKNCVSQMKLFLIKKQNLWSWDYFPHVPDYQTTD